jgi:hypothetical protein
MNLRSIAQRLPNESLITFTARGSSMIPHIQNGAEVTVERTTIDNVVVGDIVLCFVSGRYYLHLVAAKQVNKNGTKVKIANARGHVNGWSSKVFGKVIK